MAQGSLIRGAQVSLQRHGFLGVSVFAAAGMNVEELARATPWLSALRYKQLRYSTVGALRLARFALIPTQEWPHYDIELPDLTAATLVRLIRCFGPPFTNPAS